MIDFARQSSLTKQRAFKFVGNEMKLNEAIIEKDFYVVLMLEILFHKSEFGKYFAFKGGTSLSKGYNIINRFSEDIDIVMNWELIGFQEDEVWQVRSNRQQDIFNHEMNKRAGEWIENIFLTHLIKIFKKLNLNEFKIYIKEDDNQTIIIQYPRAYSISGILPEIRLEMGPLAAWTPIKKIPITSYIAEFIPQAIKNKETMISTVEAKRTFWEKATILHKEANRKNESSVRRISRHYYDVYMLAKSKVKKEAFLDLKLLDDVVSFKKKFYPDNSANYDQATKKYIQLLPKQSLIKNLYQDYENMKPMFFSTPPEFKEVLTELQNVENEIHHLEE